MIRNDIVLSILNRLLTDNAVFSMSFGIKEIVKSVRYEYPSSKDSSKIVNYKLLISIIQLIQNPPVKNNPSSRLDLPICPKFDGRGIFSDIKMKLFDE